MCLCIDLRRRFQEERLKVACKLLQLIIDANKRLSVLNGMFPKLGNCAIPLGPPRHNASAGEGDLNCRIAWHHAQPVIGEFKIADHFRRNMLAM
mgnify:CR=1 FL=1